MFLAPEGQGSRLQGQKMGGQWAWVRRLRPLNVCLYATVEIMCPCYSVIIIWIVQICDNRNKMSAWAYVRAFSDRWSRPETLQRMLAHLRASVTASQAA